MHENALDFNDIYPEWHAPWWENPWVWVAFGCVVVVIFGATLLLVRVLKRKRERREPWEIFLGHLQFLKEHRNDPIAAQAARFSFALREFLARQKNDEGVLGYTDTELVSHADDYPFDMGLKRLIKDAGQVLIFYKFDPSAQIDNVFYEMIDAFMAELKRFFAS